jgi:hypothetical protein
MFFYDVTTLCFDSNIEQEGALRQKDGKAHKTQAVLNLLVDKNKTTLYSGWFLYFIKFYFESAKARQA